MALTQQGLKKYQSAQDQHLRDLDQHLFSALTERDIAQLAAITAKILAANHTPGGTEAEGETEIVSTFDVIDRGSTPT